MTSGYSVHSCFTLKMKTRRTFLFTLGLLVVPFQPERLSLVAAIDPSFDNTSVAQLQPTSDSRPPAPDDAVVHHGAQEGADARGCEDDVVASPRRLTHAEGVVEWRADSRESARNCTWVIDVTSSGQGGLVLQFGEVRLKRGAKAAEDDTVTLYLGQRPEAGQELQRVQGSLPAPPVLLHSQTVVVTVVAYGGQQRGADGGSVSEKGHLSAAETESRFSLRYTAYPAKSLPPKLADGRYNCSWPYDVPEALRCDLVEQCQEGEDEKNYSCAYHRRDCEDWIPYGDLFCLKFVFPDSPISPLTAQSECGNLANGSRLAALPDSEGKLMAATMASLSGHQDVIIGLEKIPASFQGVNICTVFYGSGPFSKSYHLRNLRALTSVFKDRASSAPH